MVVSLILLPKLNRRARQHINKAAFMLARAAGNKCISPEASVQESLDGANQLDAKQIKPGSNAADCYSKMLRHFFALRARFAHANCDAISGGVFFCLLFYRC